MKSKNRKSKNQVNWDALKQQVIQKYGETDKGVLEEHLAYIDRKTCESDYHKNKSFRRERVMRWAALGCGASSGIMAFGNFKDSEDGLMLWVKILLTLCSIMGPLMVTFCQNSREVEKDRETWMHHRLYVNNCINECLEYSAGVGEYDGKGDAEARKLLLEKLVSNRKDNNKKFEESMK